jgi:hypothetical protein
MGKPELSAIFWLENTAEEPTWETKEYMER